MLDKFEKRAFLSVPEAAEVLGLHRQTVYRAIRNKEIPSVVLAGKILVPVDDLREMLEAQLRERTREGGARG